MLLMIYPGDRQSAAMRSMRVEAGTAGAIEVLQGQLLKITCLEAGAGASMFGFAKTDPKVYLSVHHTRVFSNSYLLGAGMRLVTNRRRPLMVLGKDTVGAHDLLMPASTTADLQALGFKGESGCFEAVQAELKRLEIVPPKIPDPVNLFMNVRLHTDGRLEPLPSTVQKGDHAVFRVVRDTVFIFAACSSGIPGNDRPGALELSAAEDLSEF
jgi:uncharacterized protein YcgI (DUF1989 family)